VLEFAHAAHAIERADRGQRKEARRIGRDDVGEQMTVHPPQYRNLDAFPIEMLEDNETFSVPEIPETKDYVTDILGRLRK
jgi:hypothetical protein